MFSCSVRSAYEFSFYTFEEDGILLTANNQKVDYETLFLSGGKVYYIFNAGSGPLELSSKKKMNDGKWHKVSTRRDTTTGE